MLDIVENSISFRLWWDLKKVEIYYDIFQERSSSLIINKKIINVFLSHSC